MDLEDVYSGGYFSEKESIEYQTLTVTIEVNEKILQEKEDEGGW